MICSHISDLLGLECYPLSDQGEVAYIGSSFKFEDGTALPIYVQKIGEYVRFFDDGEVILHLRGRGLSLDDGKKTRFLKTLVKATDVKLTEHGELEIWSPTENAGKAFADYLSALVSIVKWESEQIGVASDLSLLIDEVEMCLRTLRPDATIVPSPEYSGISGHKYRLDFSVSGDAYLAISTHPNTVSSAAKKLLDIRAAISNANLKIIVVLDDRVDPETAKSEGLILDSVANVLMMSRLEHQAGLKSLQH